MGIQISPISPSTALLFSSFNKRISVLEKGCPINQSPFYFDACLKEIYPTVKFGATTYILPKSLFMFPVKLVDFLNSFWKCLFPKPKLLYGKNFTSKCNCSKILRNFLF